MGFATTRLGLRVAFCGGQRAVRVRELLMELGVPRTKMRPQSCKASLCLHSVEKNAIIALKKVYISFQIYQELVTSNLNHFSWLWVVFGCKLLGVCHLLLCHARGE